MIVTQPDLTSLAGLTTLLDMSPLHRWLGFRIVSFDLTCGQVVISAPTGGNAQRADGMAQAHGGAVATLIDTTATFAASVAVGRVVPTVSVHVDYLRPAGGGEMTATATTRRAGRTIAVIDVELVAGGKLVALGRCVQSTAA